MSNDNASTKRLKCAARCNVSMYTTFFFLLFYEIKTNDLNKTYKSMRKKIWSPENSVENERRRVTVLYFLPHHILLVAGCRGRTPR